MSTDTSSPTHQLTAPRRAWALVARREMVVKLTDKAFLLSTFGMLAIVVVLIGVQIALGSRTSTFDVVTTPEATQMARSVADAVPDLDDNVRLDLATAPDPAAARAALRDGSADAWLERTGDGWRLTSLRTVDGDLESVVSRALQQEVVSSNAAASGTSLDQLQRGSVLATDQLEGDPTRSRLADGLGFGMSFAFYLAALLFGVALAQSVVEEKQSRLVEIIATSIPVPHLLAGKIIGAAALALGQMLTVGVVAVVGLSFTSYASALPAVASGLGWFVLFFVVGFVLVSTLYAVAGALASRTEDVQSTSLPATMVVMASFFAAALLSGVGETIGSYVPPASALIMPSRVVAGEAAWWEPLVALAILLATAALVVAAAARIYRRSLLQTSGKLSVRQAWRADT